MQIGRVNHFFGFLIFQIADLGNRVFVDSDVGRISFSSCAVYKGSVFDENVKCHIINYTTKLLSIKTMIKPMAAATPAIIQNRMVTFVSGQFRASK